LSKSVQGSHLKARVDEQDLPSFKALAHSIGGGVELEHPGVVQCRVPIT